MKAIFESGDPDPLYYHKHVAITTTIGTVGQARVQGILIEPQDAPAIDLWYNPVTKIWTIGYNIDGERRIIDLPEYENV